MIRQLSLRCCSTQGSGATVRLIKEIVPGRSAVPHTSPSTEQFTAEITAKCDPPVKCGVRKSNVSAPIDPLKIQWEARQPISPHRRQLSGIASSGTLPTWFRTTPSTRLTVSAGTPFFHPGNPNSQPSVTFPNTGSRRIVRLARQPQSARVPPVCLPCLSFPPFLPALFPLCPRPTLLPPESLLPLAPPPHPPPCVVR